MALRLIKYSATNVGILTIIYEWYNIARSVEYALYGIFIIKKNGNAIEIMVFKLSRELVIAKVCNKVLVQVKLF
jgi:hypothetical protein